MNSAKEIIESYDPNAYWGILDDLRHSCDDVIIKKLADYIWKTWLAPYHEANLLLHDKLIDSGVAEDSAFLKKLIYFITYEKETNESIQRSG